MAKAFGIYSVPRFHDNRFTSNILDDDLEVPPIGDMKLLDPYSAEYKEKVIHEFRLHDNTKLTYEQSNQLETLICKYSQVFMLPGAPYKGVDHVFHEIKEGDSQPQYTPPILSHQLNYK